MEGKFVYERQVQLQTAWDLLASEYAVVWEKINEGLMPSIESKRTHLKPSNENALSCSSMEHSFYIVWRENITKMYCTKFEINQITYAEIYTLILLITLRSSPNSVLDKKVTDYQLASYRFYFSFLNMKTYKWLKERKRVNHVPSR